MPDPHIAKATESILRLQQLEDYERVKSGHKIICIPSPDKVPDKPLVGREDIIKKALAAWTCLDDNPPLNFRLYGPPGVGKNAIVYELARILKKDLYIIIGKPDLYPEDLGCTPHLASDNTNVIEYVASPLFVGMCAGGIVFFDEIGKAPLATQKAMTTILDDRRGISINSSRTDLKASREFLFCAALNEDEEFSGRLDESVASRIGLAFRVGYPKRDDIGKILKQRFPSVNDLWIRVFVNEFRDASLSARDAIIFIGYAYNYYKVEHRHPGEAAESEIRNFLLSLSKDVRRDDLISASSPDEPLMENNEDDKAHEPAAQTDFDIESLMH
ncbi:MAG: hypothetical protein BMS9Abin06_0882 [Gammaproteobacteria bacterium]|nr:MAG: hypothetical protein BMS9Abin06_0882 [Gammaproteobacteria bacterium]